MGKEYLNPFGRLDSRLSAFVKNARESVVNSLLTLSAPDGSEMVISLKEFEGLLAVHYGLAKFKGDFASLVERSKGG